MRYWMVDAQRTPQGPFEREEIVRRIGAERIEPTRLVCAEGAQEWVEIQREFPALYGSFGVVEPDGASSEVRRTPPTSPTPRPVSAAQPSRAPEGPGAVGYVVPLGVEPCSLAAGYLGLLAPIGGCTAPFAIGLAIAGFVRLRTRPHLRGHVRCTIGIIGGLIGLGIGGIWLAVIFTR
jgi:hypothetical protein